MEKGNSGSQIVWRLNSPTRMIFAASKTGLTDWKERKENHSDIAVRVRKIDSTDREVSNQNGSAIVIELIIKSV
jgi:hypothetical protein